MFLWDWESSEQPSGKGSQLACATRQEKQSWCDLRWSQPLTYCGWVGGVKCGRPALGCGGGKVCLDLAGGMLAGLLSPRATFRSHCL